MEKTAFILLTICLCFHWVNCDSSEDKNKLNEKCNKKSNGTCGECVEIKGCSYCVPNKQCYASDLVKQTLHGKCPDNQWKVGQCVLNEKCNKKSNGTCGECVEIKGCSYCVPNKQCYASDLFKQTLHGKCPDNQWKVGQCVFTGKILIIVLPSVAGVILIALCCCIYCCCCRKKKRGSKKEDKQDAKFRRKREEIDMKHAQRRAERQVKYDEIRKKYGLHKNGDDGEDGRYHQFTNEA